MRPSHLLPAFLSAFFFALNATCANHSIRVLGTLRANLSRLVIGVLVLGLFAHTMGGGFTSAGTAWFFISGIVGLGVGDLGVYGALPLLGSRITVLMVQCLAAPLAAFGEWWGLGTRLSISQILWGGVILLGVGDLGVYGALPLLGSRITVLMVQCLAAPLAAFGEW